MTNNFSYIEYINIINLIKSNLPIIDYSEVTSNTKKFCVIRHDIEFSIDRALELALIESELGISTTYTVQLRNNTYNALSEKNIALIHKIKNLGHNIGLHQNPPHMDVKLLPNYVLKDIETLEHYYGFGIDRYAFHRPKKDHLKLYLDIPGKINCYDKKYFYYFEGESPKDIPVTYLADSNHKWKYGHPINLDFKKVNKIQLNTHPYSWTKRGYENHGNYLSLIRERNKELLHSMDTETNTFPKELLL
jgi:hypothetical protein